MDARYFATYDGSGNATTATRTATAGWSLSASVTLNYGLDLSLGTWTLASIVMPNNKPLAQKDSGGTVRSVIGISASNVVVVGDSARSVFVDTGSGNSFAPVGDNVSRNGGPSNRWTAVDTMADKFYGSSTGVITVQAPAAAGTNTITWPAATGTVALTAGATIPTIAQGDLLYGSAANTLSALAKDTGTSRFVKNSGTSNNPAWAQPAFTDLTGSVAAAQMPALTGDITTSAGAVATTLATVNANVGTFGSATQASQVTVNAKGSVTAAANVTITPALGSITGFGTGVATALAVNVGSAGAFVTFNGALGTPSSGVGTNLTGTASGLTAGNVTTNANLTGDVTSVGNATTLASVASAGTTGSSTAIPVVTIDAKGRTTSITTAAVVAPAGTLTGATLASGVTASSLTSLGTITSLTATTINAFTLGGTIAGAGNQINNVIIGTTTPLAGFFTTASATTSLTSPLHIGGSGTTGTQLTFQTTTGVGTTDAFVWKRGNNGATVAATLDNTGFGIGTVAADTLLTVNANTAASVAPSLTSLLHLVGADATEGGITIDTYGVVPRISLRRADGTQGSKTAIASADVLGAVSPYGWDGSAYNSNASFQFIASEAWTGSARGTTWRVFTTPTGTTGIAEAIRANPSGGFSVGTTSDPGLGMIYTNAATFMIRSKTSYSNGAGVGVGTLTNAPAATNPTKWIPIDDNGTTRYIPAW